MNPNYQYYHWQDFRCAYTIQGVKNSDVSTPALLLIHPIGVGLSGIFWQRFIKAWLTFHPNDLIYNPDLLGCGASEMPAVAYYSIDWAKQLKYFIENIIKKPVILIVQGASLPIAIELNKIMGNRDLIQGFVLSTPPPWQTMTTQAKSLQNKLLWNLLFNSPIGLGKLFYLYARRRQFIESFSARQLFANPEQVDANWVDSLTTAATNNRSRYAIFSFLAGFWREDYTLAIPQMQQPTLVVWGEQTSSISREGDLETLPERTNSYLKHLKQGRMAIIPGRNVLPYESTTEFIRVVTDFVRSSF